MVGQWKSVHLKYDVGSQMHYKDIAKMYKARKQNNPRPKGHDARNYWSEAHYV